MSDSPKRVDSEKVEKVLNEAETELFKMGRKTTVLFAQLPNGFELTVSSSCVDPDDYDPDLGREICESRLETKIWELLGHQAHPDL
jgi:hypothetical protein